MPFDLESNVFVEGGRSARASGCARLDEVGRLTRPRFDANLGVIRCWRREENDRSSIPPDEICQRQSPPAL
jgi:hypothetical protein